MFASFAVKNEDSKGRKFPEHSDDKRDPFQRDKDRIIHSRSFRRLDQKTQVFMAGSGDHYRTRLTHTLEVAQISRDIARRLDLNEDLAEAIALAHDLGHPPFGHAGEDALNEIMQQHDMNFEHNQQSRRTVEYLEKAYPDFYGLNLTHEVLDGLIKHQSAWDQADKEFEISASLEAQVVNLADEIAYTNHDMDDGLRSGLITLEQLEEYELWQMAKKEVEGKYGSDLERRVYISRMISTIISLMVENLCNQTYANIKEYSIKTVEDVRKRKAAIAEFGSEMKRMLSELRRFLYKNFYLNPEVLKITDKGKDMIKKLFDHYYKNLEKI